MRNSRNRYGLSSMEFDDAVFLLGEIEEEEAPELEIKVLLDQPHTTTDGVNVVSHLLVVPKGQMVPTDIQAVFNLDIKGRRVVRGRWNAISDKSITKRYPGYSVYWLCRASDRSAEWTGNTIKALLAPYEPEVPLREIVNEVSFIL